MIVFPARYRGWCPCCEKTIHIGDATTYTAGCVVHADCTDEVRRQMDDPVCPMCHLASASARNGLCADCRADA